MDENSKKLLIVGIDPGTTSAYACIDLFGRVVKLHSSKELKFSTIISDISKIGLPVIVSADKRTVPSMVKNFAVKTGARLVIPKEDLLVKDKQQLTRKYRFWNMHEMDALASALFAFKKNRALIKKLIIFIQHHKKENIAFELGKEVLAKKLPISLAAEMLERPEMIEPKKKEIMPKVQDKQKLERVARFVEKNKLLKDEIAVLKAKNQKLAEKIRQLENKQLQTEKKLAKTYRREMVKQGLKFKERTNINLRKELDAHKTYITELRDELRKIYSIITNLDDYIIVKHLKNLGSSALKHVDKGDIIHVQNPGEFSRSTLEQLKNTVRFIITKNAPAEVKKRFVVINPDKIEMKRPSTMSPYSFVKKADFEKIVNKSQILDRVVHEYRNK